MVHRSVLHYSHSVNIFQIGFFLTRIFIYYIYWKSIDISSFIPIQVEQLHRIFKLCGSPAKDYWEKMKLPASFCPPQNYQPGFPEAFSGFSTPSFRLLTTLLSLDPARRGTASSALQSEVSINFKSLVICGKYLFSQFNRNNICLASLIETKELYAFTSNLLL